MKEQNLKELMNLPQVNLADVFATDIEDEIKLFRLCSKDERSWSPEERDFMNIKINSYSPNQYSQAIYGESWFSIKVDGLSGLDFASLPNTVRDIDTYWDAAKFLEPRAPHTIGAVQDRAAFEKPGTVRCLHLPIKLPGSDIRVPMEYLQFDETLRRIFSFEKFANPSFDDYYAYLTVDQRFVPKGNSQRLPGAHVDGIPRDTKHPQRQKIDHSYLVTSNLGTRFFVHPFPIDRYDLSGVNLFAVMRYFADDTQSVETRPFDINLMNAYSVHTAYDSSAHYYRTFFRLEFSTLQFDRIGNAVNPFFDYTWEYRSRPIPAHLKLPEEILSTFEQE